MSSLVRTYGILEQVRLSLSVRVSLMLCLPTRCATTLNSLVPLYPYRQPHRHVSFGRRPESTLMALIRSSCQLTVMKLVMLLRIRLQRCSQTKSIVSSMTSTRMLMTFCKQGLRRNLSMLGGELGSSPLTMC